MSVIDFPNRRPPTFADLMRNPERDRAQIVLEAFVAGMREEGISRGVVIRSLFDHLMEQLATVPDDASATSADQAEQANILNEIDTRWRAVRDALAAADPHLFKML